MRGTAARMLAERLAEIRNRDEELRSYAGEVLRRLIAFPTVVPPGDAYREAIEYAAGELRGFGYVTDVLPTPDEVVEEAGADLLGLRGPRVNLIASLPMGNGPRVLLNAHVDVVPPGAGWSHDPFTPHVDGDRVYGRGAADNKGGVAALLVLARLMREVRLGGVRPVISVTVDEEVGGLPGLGHLVRSGKVAGDYFLSTDGYADFLTSYHNGIYRFKMFVQGKASHGSTPHRGINAVEKAAKLILAVQQYQRELLRRRSQYPAPLELSAEGFTHLFPTANVGLVRGGSKSNIVPELCEIEAERRFIPEEGIDGVRDEVRNVLAKLQGEDPELRFTLREVGVRPSALTAPDHPFVQLVRRIVEGIYGEAIPVAGMTGATDMSYISHWLHIPGVVFGPIRFGERYHEADEYVQVRDIIRVATVYLGVLSALPAL